MHSVSIRNLHFRIRTLLCGFLVVAGAYIANTTAVHAQTPPPVFQSIDQNGVDVSRGSFNFQMPGVSIGPPGAGGLVYVPTNMGLVGSWHNFYGFININDTTYTVSLGTSSETFTESSGTFTSVQQMGSTLTLSSGVFTYTTSNGVEMLYDGTSQRITQITQPNGERTTIHYNTVTLTGGYIYYRVQSITNNLGYQLHLEYSLNNPTDPSQIIAWQTVTKVTGINNAIEYCDPTANSCSLSGTWPYVTYSVSGNYQTITDSLGQATRITYSGGAIVAIRRPSSTTTDHVVIGHYNDGTVSQVFYFRDATNYDTWTYGSSDSSGTRTTTVTDPLSHQWVYTSQISSGLVLTSRDPLNNTTTYTHDGAGRTTRVTAPEGNYVNYTYDSRGNITETRLVAKSGSGLSDIVTTATYPSSCSDSGIYPATCNRPTSTTDANGYRADYTYLSHGGVEAVTQPAPSGSTPVGSGTRPQTRFTYTSLYAYYKNSGGSIVAAATPVTLLTGTSVCATSSWSSGACGNGSSDETVTTIAYGSNGVANNRVPVSVTQAAGDGAVTTTSSFGYDDLRNLTSVDGPLSGTDDTSYFVYDLESQLEGAISPDPDGGGSLVHRATRYTYNADGQATLVRQGTVTGTSGWTGWTSLQQVATTYDFVGRPVQSSFSDGTTTYSLSQTTYDAASRVDCTAVRMNPLTFGSPPSSACTLGTSGLYGPDRIARFTYDNANRPTVLTLGYGSGSAIDEWTATYSNNGQTATIADGSGNLTTYEYDGFDRVRKLRFPNPSSSGSSTTDYEQYTYDSASRLSEQRRRDAATITYAYDNLSRVTSVTPSANGASVAMTYDLMSRQLTQASPVSSPSHTLTFVYDQLSRLTSSASTVSGTTRTVSYGYDAASRRNRMTWPDGYCVDYLFNLTNEITAIREDGGSCDSTTLVAYAYDNLGRRTSLTRSSSTTTTASYTYDGASRLATLVNNLDGSTYDQTLTFSHDPLGGVASRDNNNANYNFSPLSAGTTSYADNNLNQYTSVSGTSQTYDSRGNLTTGSYGYDIFNRLTSGPSSATLSYDPAGRLYNVNGSTQFLYDGATIIGEYNGSTLLRRWVPGPGIDEPTIWYEGSGTSDSDRRWLVGDERGSITAILNNSGAATNINTYDEYGLRGASNTGRFQYTGQPWINEVSLYHYRARAYSPTLGRFLQTDPIGFDGGMNLYAYAANDPVNRSDPTGLDGDDVFVRACGSFCREKLIQWVLEYLYYELEGPAEDWTQEAVCAAASEAFANLFGKPGRIDGIFEDAFTIFGQPYTFARLTAQGAILGGGRGWSATRYTSRATGAETFVFSWSTNAGVPFRGSIRDVQAVTTITQGLGRVLTGGIGATYGSASEADPAGLSGDVDVIGGFLSGTAGTGGDFGFGPGIGGVANLNGTTEAETRALTC